MQRFLFIVFFLTTTSGRNWAQSCRACVFISTVQGSRMHRALACMRNPPTVCCQRPFNINHEFLVVYC
jgi:hypothetical protein